MLRNLFQRWRQLPDAISDALSNAAAPPRPLKRRRTDSDDGDEARPKDASAEFFRIDWENWHEDGDVVIAARGSDEDDEIHICKCHKDKLIQASPVFVDLFALPQPGTIEEIDGDPLVRLLDYHKDWRVLLRMMYDDAYVHRLLLTLLPNDAFFAGTGHAGSTATTWRGCSAGR